METVCGARGKPVNVDREYKLFHKYEGRGSVSIPAVLWYTFESVLYLRFAAHDGSVNSIWCLPEQSEYRELSG